MASTKSKLFYIVIASIVISILAYNYFLKYISIENKKSNFKDSLNSTIRYNDSIYSKNKVNENVNYNSKNIAPNNSTKIENSNIQGENVNIGSGTQNIKK